MTSHHAASCCGPRRRSGSWSLVEIGKSNGTSGQTNQQDPTRSYSAACYNSERYDRRITVNRCADQSRRPDNNAGDTKTGSDNDLQLGSALKIGWVSTTLSI